MKVKLEKFESTNTHLRTKTIIGTTEQWPKLNHRFMMLSESLTVGMDFRFITTSIVVEIVNAGDGFCEFKTENSRYRVDQLEDIK